MFHTSRLSFDHAIIDIPRAFAAGQAYVALSRCRSLEGLVLKKKLYPDAFFTDSLVSDFYDRVDNTSHINRLAKAVDFIPFEWEEDNECEQNECSETPEEFSYPAGFKEALDAASFQIYQYHETGSELDEEFWGAISHISRTSGLNVYYKMKLKKKIMSEIKDLRSRGLLL